MSNDTILSSISKEFEKVYNEHIKMLDAFNSVNHQHNDMLSAFRKVEKDHEIMTRDIREIKDMLKTLLNR